MKRFWEKSDARRLPAESVKRIFLLLDTLNAAARPEGMEIHGFGFHALRGDMKGYFAVKVTPNWRITFRWDDGAVDVDLVDYH